MVLSVLFVGPPCHLWLSIRGQAMHDRREHVHLQIPRIAQQSHG